MHTMAKEQKTNPASTKGVSEVEIAQRLFLDGSIDAVTPLATSILKSLEAEQEKIATDRMVALLIAWFAREFGPPVLMLALNRAGEHEAAERIYDSRTDA
ncbi:MAG: hypothetical protein ABFS46_18920 [Myxococcota bacterium]